MSTHSQQDFVPEYEINLSINLQIPIKIRPEVSLLSTTSNNQTDVSNLNTLIPLIKPEQTPLIQELLASIVLPENFQHAGAIKQIDAVILTNNETSKKHTPQIVLTQQNKLEIDNINQTIHRKRTFMGRAVDMFNDGFALAVNITASVMFAGKIANYSWE